ncbi:MAG: carbon-nitrogen hydrolase family protein, partial [Acidobacteriota bacterium]
VVSGAYSLSSNFSGDAGGELGPWGGAGWIIEPEEGEVLGVTSADAPFLTLDIDLGVADLAKSTYPRYVEE